MLPLAHDTVHGHGTLVVIHSLGRDDTAALYRELGAPRPRLRRRCRRPVAPDPAAPPPASAAAGPKPPKTCVVIYDFRAGSVIIVRVRHPVVDRVLVVETRSLPGT